MTQTAELPSTADRGLALLALRPLTGPFGSYVQVSGEGCKMIALAKAQGFP